MLQFDKTMIPATCTVLALAMASALVPAPVQSANAPAAVLNRPAVPIATARDAGIGLGILQAQPDASGPTGGPLTHPGSSPQRRPALAREPHQDPPSRGRVRQNGKAAGSPARPDVLQAMEQAGAGTGMPRYRETNACADTAGELVKGRCDGRRGKPGRPTPGLRRPGVPDPATEIPVLAQGPAVNVSMSRDATESVLWPTRRDALVPQRQRVHRRGQASGMGHTVVPFTPGPVTVIPLQA